jgi:hypothetical protein
VDAQTTAALSQFAGPGHGVPVTPGCAAFPEGHDCGVRSAEAKAQRVRFFESALVGVPVID